MNKPHKAMVPPAVIVRAVEKVRGALAHLNRRMLPAPAAMLELITAAWLSQTIGVAARLGVADLLKIGPRSSADLAKQLNVNAAALGRLLRALAAYGIFRETGEGRWELTSLAQTLRSDVEYSMNGFARFVGDRAHWQHWGELLNSVETGEVSVPKLRGKGFFDYLEDNRELAGAFNDAMTSVSDMARDPLIAAYDFSGHRCIVDVAGGHGRLLAAILQQAPQAQGILFDLPSVVSGAPALLKQMEVAERVRVVGGSFFEQVPEGGDCYLLKHIIHDWEESKALTILRKVREAMGPDARLLMIELVVPGINVPHFSKLLDMEMLLSVGGRERTSEEYRELLAQAGLRMTRVIATASPISLIEAVVV